MWSKTKLLTSTLVRNYLRPPLTCSISSLSFLSLKRTNYPYQPFHSFHSSSYHLRYLQQQQSQILFYNHLDIFNCDGIVIPNEAVLLGIKKTLELYGLWISLSQIEECYCTSKQEWFRKILKLYFPIDCPIVEQDFLKRFMRDYPKIQLKVFQKNPELSQIMNLDGLLSIQNSNQATVLTSMFPKDTIDFLTKRFYEQGFFPNGFFSPERNKFTTTTQISLFRQAMDAFPARYINVYVNTTCDVKELKKNFPSIHVIGIYGSSCSSSGKNTNDHKKDHKKEKLKQLGCKEVIESTKFALSCHVWE